MQDHMPYADLEALVNYVFLEIVLDRCFQNVRVLYRKLGLPLFSQFLLPAAMRRLLAAKAALFR